MQLNALLKPLKLSVAIGLVGLLAACTSNSSSTVSGPAAIIDPVEVDKTIAAVEWTPDNYVTNASHAYRVVAQNSMLEYVFTNRLAEFNTLVNLLRANTDKDCVISGRIVAESVGDVCYEVEGGEPTTCVEDSPITNNIQKSQSIACQDGTVAGLYLDGFFNLTEIIDLTTPDEERTSTIISAVDSAPTFGQDGFPILNEDGDPILKDFTDYLFQSEVSAFFFDHQYESYVDFDTNGPDNLVDLAACTNEKTTYAARQGMRSDRVGTQEGDGVDSFYLYTELTNLSLEATPSYECDGDKINVNYDYALTTTMANAAMGGGTDRNTLATWPDMDISLAGEPSGIMTLVHENEDGAYTVTVDFNTDGQVTISTPDVANPSTLTLSEFLVLSEPVTSEPVAE